MIDLLVFVFIATVKMKFCLRQIDVLCTCTVIFISYFIKIIPINIAKYHISATLVDKINNKLCVYYKIMTTKITS